MAGNVGLSASKYFSSVWIFGVVFVVTLCLDVVIREILLPYVLPQLHIGHGFVIGGDSQGFHQQATLLAEQMREHGWSRWQLKPGGNAPVGIASLLYAVFGPNPLVLLPLNAVVHGLSAVLLVAMLSRVSVRRADAVWGALPFVFFPTAAYWHSQLHRDGIYVLGMYAWLAGILFLFRSEAIPARRWAVTCGLVAAGGALTWLSREYVMVVVAALTAGGALLLAGFGVRWVKARRLRPTDLVGRIAFLLVLCVMLRAAGGAGRTEIPDYAVERYIGAAVAAPAMEPGQVSTGITTAGPADAIPVPAEQQRRLRREQCQQWEDTAYVPRTLEDLALSLVVAREGSYGSSYLGAGSTLDWQRCIMSVRDLVAYFPRAVQVGLFAPFPRQWFESSAYGGRTARALVGGEMLLAYLAIAAAVLAAWRFSRRPELWLVLFVALAMLILYAIVTPNVGTQHRMRYGFLMLIVGLGVAEMSARLRRRPGADEPGSSPTSLMP